jgi:hypothetical protein
MGIDHVDRMFALVPPPSDADPEPHRICQDIPAATFANVTVTKISHISPGGHETVIFEGERKVSAGETVVIGTKPCPTCCGFGYVRSALGKRTACVDCCTDLVES